MGLQRPRTGTSKGCLGALRNEHLNESLLSGYADRRIWLMDADQLDLRELGLAAI